MAMPACTATGSSRGCGEEERGGASPVSRLRRRRARGPNRPLEHPPRVAIPRPLLTAISSSTLPTHPPAPLPPPPPPRPRAQAWRCCGAPESATSHRCGGTQSCSVPAGGGGGRGGGGGGGGAGGRAHHARRRRRPGACMPACTRCVPPASLPHLDLLRLAILDDIEGVDAAVAGQVVVRSQEAHLRTQQGGQRGGVRTEQCMRPESTTRQRAQEPVCQHLPALTWDSLMVPKGRSWRKFLK